MSNVININDYKKKIPYEKQIELDNLMEEIKDIEGCINRTIKKGESLIT